jgi:hypothetical protein
MDIKLTYCWCWSFFTTQGKFASTITPTATVLVLLMFQHLSLKRSGWLPSVGASHVAIAASAAAWSFTCLLLPNGQEWQAAKQKLQKHGKVWIAVLLVKGIRNRQKHC